MAENESRDESEPQTKKRKGQRYASDKVPPPKPRTRNGTFGSEASPEVCDPLLGWLREISAATQSAVVSAAIKNGSSDEANEAKKKLRESPDARGEVLYPALGCFAFELALTEVSSSLVPK
jgi:hypothetical protein